MTHGMGMKEKRTWEWKRIRAQTWSPCCKHSIHSYFFSSRVSIPFLAGWMMRMTWISSFLEAKHSWNESFLKTYTPRVMRLLSYSGGVWLIDEGAKPKMCVCVCVWRFWVEYKNLRNKSLHTLCEVHGLSTQLEGKKAQSESLRVMERRSQLVLSASEWTMKQTVNGTAAEGKWVNLVRIPHTHTFISQ